MWPECFIEALEVRPSAFTGGEEQDRCTLLSAFTVGPWVLGKLALAVLDVDVGYGVVLNSTPVFRMAAPNMLSMSSWIKTWPEYFSMRRSVPSARVRPPAGFPLRAGTVQKMSESNLRWC